MNESRRRVWFEIVADLVFRYVMNVLTLGQWDRFEASRKVAKYSIPGDAYTHHYMTDQVDKAWRDLWLGFVRFVTAAAVAVTCLARFVMHSPGIDRGDFFKDWAHLLVGWLVGAACVSWWHRVGPWRFYALCAVVLTGAEVVAFMLHARGFTPPKMDWWFGQ